MLRGFHISNVSSELKAEGCKKKCGGDVSNKGFINSCLGLIATNGCCVEPPVCPMVYVCYKDCATV